MNSKLSAAVFILLLVAAMPVAAQTGAVEGLIYHDEDLSSRSHYMQSIEGLDAPLQDIDVFLLGGCEEEQALSDEQGRFVFDDLDPGTYFLDVGLSGYDCTSNNQGLRTPEAIREGHIEIVCMGDSIGNMGAEIPYPTRLSWYFEELTEVTLHNIHVGGSRSWEWLPGSEKGYFEDRLLPLLPDADLVTLTITGNDADAYVEGLEPPYDIWQIIRNLLEHPEYIIEAVPRLVQILEEIKAVNPVCDVVFVLYPNFANSTIIESYTGPLLQPVAALAVNLFVSAEREASAEIENIVLADMIEYYGDTWMDPFLVDEVHPSDAGAQDYANQIFLALGGVVIEEEKMGEERYIGFYAPDLAPGDDDDNDDDDDAADDDDDVFEDDDDDAGADEGDDDDEGCCG